MDILQFILGVNFSFLINLKKYHLASFHLGINKEALSPLEKQPTLFPLAWLTEVHTV